MEEAAVAHDEPRSKTDFREPYEPASEIEASAATVEPESHHEPEHFERPERPSAPAPPQNRPAQPGSRLTVQKAIDEVNQIVANLRETQELMEDVLESLEYFERQGNADEREIESLRRALRHLQRPREGGHTPRGR